MCLGYCLECGQPLTEFDMCSYGDTCMSCYERLEEEAEEEIE